MSVISLIENKLVHTALVLDARSWESAAFYEIDLHIPGAHFEDNGIQHIKCRVDQLTYRDYTIARWDAETKTCTLFIDAAHQGKGSLWAGKLKRGDNIKYLKIETHRCDCDARNCLFLGDVSAIGHFLAIQQLLHGSATINGAIVLHSEAQCSELKAYYPGLPVSTLPCEDDSKNTLCRRLDSAAGGSIAYLAGNAIMVAAVRRQLKRNGYAGEQIKAQGFWR